MKKTQAKKRITKPPLDRFGGVRVVQRRIQKSEIIEQNKEGVAQELIDVGRAKITDIVDWDENGVVRVRNPENVPESAIKAIKRIRMTQTQAGPQIDIEMHDKVAVLRILAKAAGLLEPQEEMDKPSVVGIVMEGPKDE
ncbi:terminase small subunit [Marinobacter sp.]|jgi:hypothetical protein|uniref:terminase small subunit n=1 Tax=Marinobacter sp. TaxID=50741 RepID=UPI000C8E3BAF|nr:terminase small subunit [Marinobacter sp.]MAK51237.1 hypothetical protein [Marinobacter sp.]|tara:strand:- start:350 stop:766 length:417 start_codon:yes stop_codon:yes gene_type:complete